MKKLCKDCIVYACCNQECSLIDEYIDKMVKICLIFNIILISIVSIFFIIFLIYYTKFPINISVLLFIWIVSFYMVSRLGDLNPLENNNLSFVISPFVYSFVLLILLERIFVLRNLKPEFKRLRKIP